MFPSLSSRNDIELTLEFCSQALHSCHFRSTNPKKDTESKNVDSLDSVFVVIHIECLITTQDDSGLIPMCLQKRTRDKYIY